MQAHTVGVAPPNANAAVFVPAPAKAYLAVPKAPPADQDVPLYVSVQATVAKPLFKPPNANAAVFVPAPAKPNLAVIKAPPADHDVPLYASVQDIIGPLLPPNAKAAVFVPAPAKTYLALIIAPPADQASAPIEEVK